MEYTLARLKPRTPATAPESPEHQAKRLRRLHMASSCQRKDVGARAGRKAPRSVASRLCRHARGRRLLRRQRRETAPARHKGPGKTSYKASATSLPPDVRAKSASGRGLRAHARGAGQVRRKRDKGHLFGTESGPRRPVSWVRSAGRIRPEEQGPHRGGSGAARALPGAPRPAASTLRLSLFHRVLPSASPASRELQ